MTTLESAAASRPAWPGLFSAAFMQSRNAMVLLDDHRRHVDVNGAYLKLVGRRRDQLIGRPVYELIENGPVLSAKEWTAALGQHRFTGEARLLGPGGDVIAVQWAAATETVTGRRLVLFVVLSTSRWGRRFRRAPDDGDGAGAPVLTAREREVVHLVALGETSAEIADELGIAPHTVSTHVRNAMTKVGARSRAHLVAKALGEGLIFL